MGFKPEIIEVTDEGARYVERGHLFYLDKWISMPGAPHVDSWRLNSGIHNGPECMVCHKVVCDHCNKDFRTEVCELVCGVCLTAGSHKMDCPNR